MYCLKLLEEKWAEIKNKLELTQLKSLGLTWSKNSVLDRIAYFNKKEKPNKKSKEIVIGGFLKSQ